MNFVGLDPSLISTAMVVNGKLFNYCREKDAMNKSGFSKWFKYCEDKVTFRFIEYRETTNYSEGELIKLKDYDKITDQIIKDIEDKYLFYRAIKNSKVEWEYPEKNEEMVGLVMHV